MRPERTPPETHATTGPSPSPCHVSSQAAAAQWADRRRLRRRRRQEHGRGEVRDTPASPGPRAGVHPGPEGGGGHGRRRLVGGSPAIFPIRRTRRLIPWRIRRKGDVGELQPRRRRRAGSARCASADGGSRRRRSGATCRTDAPPSPCARPLARRSHVSCSGVHAGASGGDRGPSSAAQRRLAANAHHWRTREWHAAWLNRRSRVSDVAVRSIPPARWTSRTSFRWSCAR